MLWYMIQSDWLWGLDFFVFKGGCSQYSRMLRILHMRSHPERLGLAVKFSDFYDKVLNYADGACNFAKQAVDEAPMRRAASSYPRALIRQMLALPTGISSPLSKSRRRRIMMTTTLRY